MSDPTCDTSLNPVYRLGMRVRITRSKPPHRLAGRIGVIAEIVPDHTEDGDGDLLIVDSQGRRVPCFGADLETI
jgi:hypothetical protein